MPQDVDARNKSGHDDRGQEKGLEKWPRAWKLGIIERDNPGWRDLYDDIGL